MSNTNRITDVQYDIAQRAIDALTRKTRRGQVGTAEELERYAALVHEWEAANALPYVRMVDLEARDVALLAVATKYGLI